MKLRILLLLLICIPAFSQSPQNLAVFWNLENFLEDNTRHYYEKVQKVSKTLLWMGEYYGRMPDLIGVAEVENLSLLKRLVYTPILKDYRYSIVHFDSPDPRGIDVALLYRKDGYNLLGAKPVSLKDSLGNLIQTRNILVVELEDREGRGVTCLVNHHPSKYSGTSATQTKRERAMRTMVSICDSLKMVGKSHIISMGDFNDTPDSVPFRHLPSYMKNMAEDIHARGEGTIKFNGKWETIDMFIVSSDLDCRMEICYPPFLMTEDKQHTGFKPLRSFSGPRYLGGVSDHCPIVLIF
jgi:hypothetical protein